MRRKKKKLRADRSRLNLVLDKELKSWAMDYAIRHRTKLTQIIVDYLHWLQEKEKGIDVKQI